jgi:Fe-S-cluster containining protein
VANLGPDPERERRAASRQCGACSLCCTVLRVDELGKRAGHDCVHQRDERGCSIHATRPDICRRYRCLWLQGGLEDGERPNQTGGIVDLETTGVGLRLGIRVMRRGDFEASPALQAIAERYRNEMPVRISDVEDVMNPDHPFRVLLADGIEHRVAGERIEIHRDGELIERRTLPWAERWVRRLTIRWRNHKLHRP